MPRFFLEKRLMRKRDFFNWLKCQTYTYFLVEGKTSATAPYLALFIEGRYFHADLPIVKHSTELSDSPF